MTVEELDALEESYTRCAACHAGRVHEQCYVSGPSKDVTELCAEIRRRLVKEAKPK